MNPAHGQLSPQCRQPLDDYGDVQYTWDGNAVVFPYLSAPAMDKEPKANTVDRLTRQYGIHLFNSAGWSLIELQHLHEALEDLATLMGGATRFQSEIPRVFVSRFPLRMPAAAMSLPLVGVTYFKGASWGYPRALKWQTVHELGHMWDMRKLLRLSNGLRRVTGSKYGRIRWQLPIPFEYEPGGRWLKGRKPPLNHLEDWADSVATYVYRSYADQRKRMISPVRWEYVSQHMQVRLPYPSHWIPYFYDSEETPDLSGDLPAGYGPP